MIHIYNKLPYVSNYYSNSSYLNCDVKPYYLWDWYNASYNCFHFHNPMGISLPLHMKSKKVGQKKDNVNSVFKNIEEKTNESVLNEDDDQLESINQNDQFGKEKDSEKEKDDAGKDNIIVGDSSWKNKILLKQKRSYKNVSCEIPINKFDYNQKQIMLMNMNKRNKINRNTTRDFDQKSYSKGTPSRLIGFPFEKGMSKNSFSKTTVFCANCGGYGHVYKNCNYPITSFGIICYRLRTDSNTHSVYPEYLLVQRKDSLNFVEFIRGKYSLEKRNYIMKMFANMTEEEREEIKNNEFPFIWMKLWKINHCNHFESEYKDSKSKFDCIKKGYFLDTDSENVIWFDIDYILNNTISTIDQSEWGFPKGKRNINEQDIDCAVREFVEETSMRKKYLKLHNMKPFEEVFTGTNKVRYKHVYYLASCTNLNDRIVFHSNIHSKIDINEIKSVGWFRFTDSLNLIREQNVERRELFKRVNQIVLKNICQV